MNKNIDSVIISTENFIMKDISKWKIDKQRSTSYKTVFIKNEGGLSITITQFAGNSPSILVIAGSVPNLCHNNNFEGTQKNDISKLLNHIVSLLIEMDIEITSDDILNANVKRVDFTTDLILPKGMTCLQVMQKISTSRLSRMENTQQGYKNGGSQYLIRCKSWGCSWYNKKQQMGEKLKSLISPEIYSKHDILRMELRFSTKMPLQRWLKKAGINVRQSIKFKDLFEEGISQKILIYIWNLIKENIPKVYEIKNATDMFNRMECPSPHIKDRLAYAQLEQMKSENGAEEMKLLIENCTKKKNAYNFFREHKKNCKVNAPIKHSDILDEISKQLEEDIFLYCARLQPIIDQNK